MHLSHLQTARLTALAEAEDRAFRLPQDWQRGREVATGITIDPPGTRSKDDALGAYTTPDGKDILEKHFVDPGPFVVDQEAMLALAYRLGTEQHSWKRPSGVLHTLPPSTRRKCSLDNEKERPAITASFSVAPDGTPGGLRLHRTRLTAHSAARSTSEKPISYADSPDYPTLRLADTICRRLHAARTGNKRVLEKTPTAKELHFGALTLQESTITASALIARFMRDHGIPTLYQHQRTDYRLFDRLSQYVRDTPGFSEKFFSEQALQYPGVPPDHPLSAPIRAPFWNYPSLVNHLNLAAYFDGREYPFPEHWLALAAKNLNHQSVTYQRFGRTYIPLRIEEKRPMPRPAKLIRAIDRGAVNTDRLAQALFGEFPHVDHETRARLRGAAASYIAGDVRLAEQVVHQAIGSDLVRVSSVGRGSGPRQVILTDQAGKSHPYEATADPLARANAICNMFATLADIEVEPALPRASTRAGKILANAEPYLKKLAEAGCLSYNLSATQLKEQSVPGAVLATVAVKCGNRSHVVHEISIDRAAAVQAAMRKIIRRLDLIDNPPPRSFHSLVSEADAEAQLAQHLDAASASEPMYKLTSQPHNWGDMVTCSVKVKAYGQTWKVKAVGYDETSTRCRAAAKLHRQLLALQSFREKHPES